jgi:leucyl/phenylalanyl-tRNA--protein transferase
MPLYRFPNLLGVPAEKTPEGVVAIGGDLSPENVLEAYRNGIFPWPISDEYPLAWFSPDPRAVLDFDRLHLPRSLKRAQNQKRFTFTQNQAFETVIQTCRDVPRAGQDGTWITDPMVKAYIQMHKLGFAHSFEAWAGTQLVGGIYGVLIDGAFAGESMFHHAANASKLILVHMAEYFLARGLHWMDIQMMTPHLKLLGAHEISRDDYLSKLAQTRALGLKLF